MEPLELDHLGFACRELEPLLQMFAALGFAPTSPRPLQAVDEAGRPRPLGQTSAHLVFGHTYVELSAVPDPDAGNHLEPFLARYCGLHIVALRANDIDACHDALAGGDLSPTPIMEAARRIEYGARHGEARFRWFMLPAAPALEGLVCVVHNQSPELVYQAGGQAHPNGALDLTGLLLCVPELEASVRRWESWLGASAQQDEQGVRIEMNNATLRLVTPQALAAGKPSFRPPAAPCVAGMEVTVPALAPVRALAGRAGRAHHLADAATLRVALPAPANAIVTFRAVEA